MTTISLQQLLDTLQTTPFYMEEDKQLLTEYVTFLFAGFDDTLQQDFSQYFVDHLEQVTHFSPGILLDPREFLLGLLHSDYRGSHVSHKEFFVLYTSLVDYETHHQQHMNDKERLEKTYNITIEPRVTDGDRHSIHAQAIDHVHFVAALPELKKQLAKYPPLYIKNIQLKKIIIASNFYKKQDGPHCTHLGGFTSSNNNNVYLSVQHIRKSFDHELYHQAMHRYNDINQRANLRKPHDGLYQHEHLHKATKGYASNYGRENVAEDQATVAEHLLRDPGHMFHRAKHDSILAKKVDLVLKAFARLSDGRMNKQWLTTLM